MVYYEVQFERRRGKRRDARVINDENYCNDLAEAREQAADLAAGRPDNLVVGKIVIVRIEQVEVIE